MKSSELFSPEERGAIERAIAEVEAKTSAEIVPVVASASGSYSRAEDLLGIWCGVLGFLALGLAHPERQIDLLEGLLVFFLGLLLGGGLLSRIPSLKRSMTGEEDREKRAVEAAERLFTARRIGRTAERTGVLLYLSLFERVAVVLADEKASEALGKDGTERVRDVLLEGMKERKPVEGFRRAVLVAGERLAAKLPRATGDANELPDRLVFID
ncbi:MAG: TPM domain-containing protein [Planctomycetota bacterium]